ncbi:MAG: hypothetical protein IKH88_04905 [Prevotella sp.]|nr:hypothetical protein [Prevotella sp.]
MEIINHNPYRLLGIFGNLSIRDIVSQASKMKAHMKVGQTIDAPLQMNRWLSDLVLTEQEVKSAEDLLRNPSEKDRYAMFWFEKHNDEDEQFVNLFSEKKVDEAMACLSGRNDHAALQNMLTAGLIMNNWQDVLYLAMCLHKKETDIKLFLDTLCREVNISVLRNSFKPLSHSAKDDAITAMWQQQIDEKASDYHNRCLEDFYKKVVGINPRHTEAMKETLEQFLPLSEHIEALKDILGEDNAIYQARAEKYIEKIWSFTELCLSNKAGNIFILPKIARRCRDLAVMEATKKRFDNLAREWEKAYQSYLEDIEKKELETPEEIKEESVEEPYENVSLRERFKVIPSRKHQLTASMALMKKLGCIYLFIFWLLVLIAWMLFH